jgi:glycosyltransferase involved in cell wall biosynthesis
MNAKGKSDRLRVLVVSYECSPVLSHVAGSAWQIVSRLSKWHDLWVITEETQYKRDIEKFLSIYPNSWIHFIFIKGKKYYSAKARPIIPIRSIMGYRRWLYKAYRKAEKLHRLINFEIVHHLRGNSFREPGYCWQLPVPFIWGPMGGNIGIPRQLMPALGKSGYLMHSLRNIMNYAQPYISPRIRKAAKKASVIFTQTTIDQHRMKMICDTNVVIGHEQAADTSGMKLHRYNPEKPLRIAWASRFVQLKGLPILLKAAAGGTLKNRIEIHIAGDGPCRKEWMGLARRLNILENCIWYGWLSPADTVEIMKSCDVFACTNLLAAESTTTMQAISQGLPVVCIRRGWKSDIIDQTCGIPIKISNPEEVVSLYYRGFMSLIQTRGLLENLSKGAARKAKNFTWDCLAEKISRSYEFSHQRNTIQRGSHHPPFCLHEKISQTPQC